MSLATSYQADEYITSLSFCKERPLLGFGCADGKVFCMDMVSRKTSQVAQHQKRSHSIVWLSGGVGLSAGDDGKIFLWDGNILERDQSQAECIYEGVQEITCLAVSEIGSKRDQKIVAAGIGKKIATFELKEFKSDQKISNGAQTSNHWKVIDSQLDYEAQPGTIEDICPIPGCPEFLSAAYMGAFQFRHGHPQPVQSYSWKGNSLKISISPDSRYIAAAQQDKDLHVWVVKNKTDLSMSGYAYKPLSMTWSKDGRYLATSGSEDITLWDCSGPGPAGRMPLTLRGHIGKIEVVKFTQDPCVLASAGKDGRMILWNHRASLPILAADEMDEPIVAMDLLQMPRPNQSMQTWIAVGCENGEIRVYSLEGI